MQKLIEKKRQLFINSSIAQRYDMGLSPRSPGFESCYKHLLWVIFLPRTKKNRLHVVKIPPNMVLYLAQLIKIMSNAEAYNVS